VKDFFNNWKIICNISKEHIKELIKISIICLIFTIAMTIVMDNVIFLFFNLLVLVIWSTAYRFYKPAIDSAHKQLHLNRKYSTMIKKFNKTY